MPTLVSSADGKQWPGQAGETAPVTAVHQYELCGSWVVATHGPYDMHSTPPLADALNAAVRKHPKVILDASGVDFADSSFLNLLILTHQAGTLRVAAPPEQLQRLFAITGTDAVLEIRATVNDAAAP
ncbi:STAS domain-containing protein [Streptomyces misionensis]|uniref:STAS domain-containing protein n=2 Tax=Streptomyces misionensis TaxID=67331 RepID=A0A5C6JU75_9ACTN|nr:STAS domain-containing protein [Streptomyces misionensis]